MKIVNIHDAKTNLSKLVDAAARGEPFVIARAGTPLVRVTALQAAAPRRVGFLEGTYAVPEDFDALGADEIRRAFEGDGEPGGEPDGGPDGGHGRGRGGGPASDPR